MFRELPSFEADEQFLPAIPRNLAYRFYFSRRMDLEETVQQRSDQRSIQFDRYQGRLVQKITGNYFASYSDDLIKPEERARQTYETVMFPLLEAAVHALEKADVPEAFAFEISHHVRKKVLGVTSEAAENVVLILARRPLSVWWRPTTRGFARLPFSKGKLSSTPFRLLCGIRMTKPPRKPRKRGESLRRLRRRRQPPRRNPLFRRVS
jgi:hypothetical protein